MNVRRPVSSYLYESVARSVVCDGETQSIFRLEYLHVLLDPFDVSKDKILKANLPPQQLVHVNLVGVEGTEQNLHRQTCSGQMIPSTIKRMNHKFNKKSLTMQKPNTRQQNEQNK